MKEAMKGAQLLWNDCLAEVRAERLLTWAGLLMSQAGFDQRCTQMVNYQVKHGLALINGIQIMPGPTGESNELYSTGRGVFVISADVNIPIEGLIGQISSALLAGNAIVLSLMKKKVITILHNTLLTAGIPENVIEIIPFSQLELFIKTQDIAGVAYIGEESTIKNIDSLLAHKEGLLAKFVFEDEFIHLPNITAPNYILHFISERTRTINISAVGGNVALLALASGD